MSWNLQSRTPLTDAVQDQEGVIHCNQTVQDLLGVKLVQYNIINGKTLTSQPTFTDIPNAEIIQTNNSNA